MSEQRVRWELMRTTGGQAAFPAPLPFTSKEAAIAMGEAGLSLGDGCDGYRVERVSRRVVKAVP